MAGELLRRARCMHEGRTRQRCVQRVVCIYCFLHVDEVCVHKRYLLWTGAFDGCFVWFGGGPEERRSHKKGTSDNGIRETLEQQSPDQIGGADFTVLPCPSDSCNLLVPTCPEGARREGARCEDEAKVR